MAAFALHLLALSDTTAFDGWEHETLGNVALEANLYDLRNSKRLFPGVHDTFQVQQAITVLKMMETGVAASADMPPIKYGDIVRLVDYMRDNYAMTHGRKTKNGWPRSPDETNLRYLQGLSSKNTSFLQALHSNHDHFQDRAMYSFWFWHDQATKVASEGNLWGGLLLNAYSDHFLQDFFAPGHVTSPRDDNSHDLWALTVHDSYNSKGMIYHVRQPSQCHSALGALLDFVRSGSVDFGPNPRQTLTIIPSLIEQFLKTSDEAFIHCLGDGLLKDEPGQIVLITAYSIQSISDVVSSFLNQAPVNSFQKYTWNLRFGGSSQKQLEIIDLNISFGDLTCIDHVPNLKYVLLGDTNGIWRLSPERFRSEFPEVDIVTALSRVAARNPVFGANAGLQHISAEGSHARGLLEFETMIGGARWDYLREDFPTLKYLPSWPEQVGLSLGYSGLFGEGNDAHGFVSRAVLPMPKLNIQLSLYGGMRYYARDSFGEWADFQGIRAEWGYHLGHLFLGVGRDHYPSKNADELRDGLSVEAGVSAYFNYSRVRKLLKKIGD